jgi:AAA family ATP:ADP antiporter
MTQELVAAPPPSTEPPWLSRLLAPITEVRPGEAITALIMTTNVFLLLTAYYLIKPVREALILALESGAEYKSYMSGAIAVALLFAVPAYAKIVDRLPRRKLVVGVSLFFALHLVLFYGASLSQGLRSQIGLFFYLWVGIFNMMVVAQFWAFANDIYGVDQGKRIFPLIALGGSLGAAVGSKVAAGLIPLFGLFPMLLVAAALLALCAVLFRAADMRAKASPGEPLVPVAPESTASKPTGGAFQIVFQHRYLLLIAAFSLVFSWVNTNGEYLLGKLIKAAAVEAVGRKEISVGGIGDYIGAAYGEFFFYVNVLGVVLQTFVVSRLIRRIGVGPAFFVLPLIALADASAVAVLPVLAILRIGKVAENATDYSLNNTLRQMLWLPTTREMKYKAKQAVDTFCVRMGDVSSALLVYGGTVFFGFTVRTFSIVNVALIGVWLVVAVAIVREQARMSVRKPE